MPFDYLNAFNSLITESQRVELARILEEKIQQGEITEDNFGSELEKLIARINPNNKPLIRLRLIDTTSEELVKISSSDYNDTINDAQVDLITLYNEANLTSDVIGRHEEISKDFVRSMKTKLEDLRTRVRSFKLAASDRSGFSAIFEENFTKSIGTLKNADISDNALRLAEIPGSPAVFNSGPLVNSVNITRLPAENQANVVYASTPDHDVEFDYNDTVSRKRNRRKTDVRPTRSMLRSGTTYGVWVEVALTDTTVVQKIDNINYQGVVGLLNIVYNGAHDINSIIIDPYSDHELLIPRVRYKAETDVWRRVNTQNKNGEIIPLSGRGTDIIRLEGFGTLSQITELEIMFYQPNSSLQRFLIDNRQIYDIELWDELLEREYEKAQENYRYDTDRTLDRHEEDFQLQLQAREATKHDLGVIKLESANSVAEMLSTARDVLNISNEQVDRLSQTLTGDPDTSFTLEQMKPNLVEIHKNEYIYGAYSVVPQRSLYVPTSGIFVSPLYDSVQNVITQVGLETTDIQPSGVSIAYSLIDAESRTAIPILPKGVKRVYEYVENPRIDASGKPSVEWETRFPVTSGTLSTFVNLHEIQDAIIFQRDNVSRGSIILASGVALTQGVPAIVTCEYTPQTNTLFLGPTQRDPNIVDLENEVRPINIIESNTATDLEIQDHRIVLKHYPYIDYKRFNFLQGIDRGQAHETSGGEFLLENLPLEDVVNPWRHIIKLDIGAVQRQDFVPYLNENAMWNTAGTDLIIGDTVFLSGGRIVGYSLKSQAITLLRFNNIPINFRYCISNVREFIDSSGNNIRSLTIAFLHPTTNNWISIFAFNWSVTDSEPMDNTIYEATSLSGFDELGFANASCKIRVNWSELFSNATIVERPTEFPTTPDEEFYTGLQGALNPGGDPTDSIADPLNVDPNDGLRVPWTLSSIHNLRVLLTTDIFGSNTVASGVYLLPDFSIDSPGIYSNAEIVYEVINDNFWQELEEVGWTEDVVPSSFLQSDQIQNLFRPVRLFVNGIQAIDKTSYKQIEQDGLEPFSLANEYQYYLHNDTLFTNFDFEFQEPKSVEVRYAYLTDGVRLQSVLRSNRPGPSDTTPIVQNYRIKFRSRQ